MVRRRERSGPLVRRAVAIACASLLPACGAILGLDQGIAIDGDGDASSDATSAHPAGDDADGASRDDSPGLPGDDGGSQVTPGSHTDSGAAPKLPPSDGVPDGCTPDPGWCDVHCGNGPDNCGANRKCPSCSAGNTCGESYTCVCQSDPQWCTGRCGQTIDNCEKPIDCAPCGPMPCQPESMAQACGSRQCGTATNNCKQTVNCGLLGLVSTCLSASQVCVADGGCCTPDSAAACGTQCGTFVTDNCGRSVQCPTTCGSGRVCYENACCTPNNPCAGACGVSRVNSCGQTVQCGCSAGNAECVTATKTCCVPRDAAPTASTAAASRRPRAAWTRVPKRDCRTRVPKRDCRTRPATPETARSRRAREKRRRLRPMSDEKRSFDSGPSMPFVPGVVVDGKYRLERPIGRGGMGFIVLGRHVQLDQPVAAEVHARVARAYGAQGRSPLSRRGESRGVPPERPRRARLGHRDLPGVAVHGHGVPRGRDPRGAPAATARAARRRSPSATPCKRAKVWPRPTRPGSSIATCKPANLFVARQHDGSVRIKLLDFGIFEDGRRREGTEPCMGRSPTRRRPRR